jgi:hypothetical protein
MHHDKKYANPSMVGGKKCQNILQVPEAESYINSAPTTDYCVPFRKYYSSGERYQDLNPYNQEAANMPVLEVS